MPAHAESLLTSASSIQKSDFSKTISAKNYRKPASEIPDSDDKFINDLIEIDFVQRKDLATDVVTTKCKIKQLVILAATVDLGANFAIISEDITKRLKLVIDTKDKHDYRGIATIPTESLVTTQNVPVDFTSALPDNYSRARLEESLQDLKKELYITLQDSSEISYIMLNCGIGANTEIQKLCTHNLELIDEARHLQIENANKDISLAKFKAENDIKSKKIKSLESMIKILEGKLSLAQKDVISIQSNSLKKETEIVPLKSKIAELENIKSKLKSKVNELECLKLKTISKPIVGGDDEKNITKSDNISLDSTDLSKYFIYRKNMDQTKKTNSNILTYTNDEITELSKNNTEANSKII
ncbi:17660_t:CDS:2 [Cetraspora pellucida]|uniref:17660_t:CDS:1 n=1 Tax=Cetraspora pellucida TaxID=1433469 RepID=A0A9N9ARS0_9GLOM|nr:17660_t:CDS:2 [Cetraspora pellucida]